MTVIIIGISGIRVYQVLSIEQPAGYTPRSLPPCGCSLEAPLYYCLPLRHIRKQAAVFNAIHPEWQVPFHFHFLEPPFTYQLRHVT